MSLYGALFAGVSGLKSQANKLGVISDNVANVNTVGFKGGNGLFETLVTSSSATAAYSPGGVIGGNRLLVSKQGLLQATDSATDIAISGNGFYVVNANAAGDGQVGYTRSGSFRADSTGNFRNTSGFYLQAWPLDREGRLPGASGNTTYTTSSANLSSLQVVNVQNLTGSAAATSSVAIGANLNASQTVFPGAAGEITMDSLSTDNFGIAAKDIIVPSATNKLARGDKIVISTGNNLDFTYRYGGFTHSRDVTDAGEADSEATLLAGTTTLGTDPYTFTSGSNIVTVAHTAHGLVDGAVITLSGNITNIAGISASEFNGNFVVDVIDANSYTITTASSASATTLGTAPLAVTNGSPTVTVTQVGHGLAVGQSITIAGAAAIGGITPNGTFTVASVTDADTYTYTFTSNATSTVASGGGNAVTEFTNDGGGTAIASITRPFSGNIMDATNTETRFLATTGTSGYTTTALTFNITTAATGTVTFSYTSASPDVRQKQFNTLTNLAASINEVTGLSARVVNNQLYVGATDANAAITFSNGSTLGINGPPVQAGLDWVRELGLKNVLAGSGDRFSSLEGLYNLAITDSGISASIENPLGAAELSINVDDPLDTIHFADSPTRATLTAFTSPTPFSTTSGSNVVTVTHPAAHGFSTGDFITLNATGFAAAGPFNGIPLAEFSGRFEITVTGATTYTITVDTAATSSGTTGDSDLLVTPHNNLGSLVAELGLVDSLNGATFTPQETDDFGPAYNPTDTNLNMASGNVSSHFSRPIRVYDAQGGGHDLNVAFLKVNANDWAIEVYAVPQGDVSSSLPNGVIAYGNVSFNGDGTLRSVDTTLSNNTNVTWTNGASTSTIVFNWGTQGQAFGTLGATTFGKADGLSQFNAAFKVSFANQNGAPVGELTGVSITDLGVIVASYSNGQTQALYKIPLADFANPDQLSSSTGNVFTQSADSGEFNLRQAGTSGVGKIAASSLEASNVELSAELTDMIIAQRSYQANAKVISTSDNMLEQLNQIIR